MAEFDAALREAAVRGFELNGSGPFALFLNAAAETLGDAAEQIPSTRQTVVIEITERALIANPDSLLHALTRFRVHGWGVAIDDVGADSRSLALMPLLYPDVIKLDLRRLQRARPRRRGADRRRGRARRASAARRWCWPRASTPRSSSPPRARSAPRSARATCSASRRRCRGSCPSRAASCG